MTLPKPRRLRVKEEKLDEIDNRVLHWFVRPLPTSMFYQQYWVGLVSGFIVGIIWGIILL